MEHFTIAVAGKGGVGKTTLAGLLVSRLIARGRTPVLAVDADPNTCLDQVLGLRVEKTVGAIREDVGKAQSMGMDKQRYLELRIAESLVEADNFDLIAMGRPEGPGCYCYANAVLKDVLAQVAEQYPYVVVDNEAGLENLSRRLITKTDLLVLVGDPSARGLETISRLHSLAREMGVEYGRLAVVVNKLRQDALPEQAQALKQATRADFLLGLPLNDELAELDEAGQSLELLDQYNEIVARLDKFLHDAGLAELSA